MKTAIYIEDGLTQFVLTPETEIDKKVLGEMESTELKTFRGNFYACIGGWTRQDPNNWAGSSVWRNQYLNSDGSSDESLIFVIEKKKPSSAPAGQITEQANINAKLDGCCSHPSVLSCLHDPLNECEPCRRRRTLGS